MKTLKILFTFSLLTLVSASTFAQQKVWVTGAARGIYYGDAYSNQTQADTITPKRLESGHAMVDLGVNIQPSDKILIQSMVRVRNDYGGFWGAGVTFDVRQLYIKGIIGNFLKYQLGDIDYKLTPYTFQNNRGMVNSFEGNLVNLPLQQIQYDMFYMEDQTWRQQGAAIDFALEFSRFVQEMKFDLFTTRIRPTNFGTQDDRLYSGGSVTLMQSKKLNLGVQYANLYDLEGTSNSTIQVRNPVITASAEGNFTLFNTNFNAALETGRSTLEWAGDDQAPVLEDYFYDVSLKASWADRGLSIKAGYRDVGANFRSAGAQSLQINFDRAVRAFSRYGNDQSIRPITMLDLYSDAALYNTQIATGLANYDPRYDNATPYGVATPNRRGFNVLVNYEDKKDRFELEGRTDILTNVVGEGTSSLKDYNTMSIYGKLNINELLGWNDRKFWISARTGMQNTSRSGEQTFEDVDLATNFTNVNLTATIIGDLDLIGEWRIWQSKGSELVAERNLYSEIIDFTGYDIDYNESIVGAGIQYNFSEKTQLSLLWQSFNWEDVMAVNQEYTINSLALFFTMKF